MMFLFVNVTSLLLDGLTVTSNCQNINGQRISQSSVCHQKIHDPLWSKQWYLKAGSQEYGINVFPAWQKCYNGTGIVVAVVDTGVNARNADLDGQVLNLTSGISINAPLQSQHGTEVAGLIAAKANDQFGRGIAFGARIADYRFVDPTKDADIAGDVLKLKSEQIDIYSCSFSRFPDGFSIYKMGINVRNDLEYGTTKGRQNRGSIYVVSSGNGGENFFADSCAYQEFMNNRHVILVAGVNHVLGPIPTGEKCSAIMVTAPTRELGTNVNPPMITTMGDTFTTNFGMTSAAVAIVSGSIAVLLSANKDLTYRDVMHILTRTSRSNSIIPFPRIDEPFRCNDAGFLVSSQYGFGLIDVNAMVEEARCWKPVGIKNRCFAELGTKRMRLTNIITLKIDPTCNIQYLEHVEVQLIINARGIGHSKIFLQAPGNFSSKILPGRVLDGRQIMDISVQSVQFWGHNPKGLWFIKIVDDKLDKTAGIMVDVRLTLHGLQKEPETPIRTHCKTIGHPREKNEYVNEEGNLHTQETPSIAVPFSIPYVWVGLSTLLQLLHWY